MGITGIASAISCPMLTLATLYSMVHMFFSQAASASELEVESTLLLAKYARDKILESSVC